jgi:protoporphyrinogen oxidase
MSAQPHTDALSADIVIIGAGMAGLYTAWRLLRQNPKRRIRLLERLPRTGGRLETDHVLLDGVTVKTEEGGMRFLSTHVELLALLDTLGLSNDEVPFPMGGPSNLYYLRGKRFTVGEATANPSIWSTLYAVNPGASGLQPGDVLKNVLTAVLKENHV